jgi:tetraacyldisaccharide 4'-kinase
VGNLTTGGTGKTPLVTWLVDFLRASGYRPGVIARGYKGRARHWPQPVRADSDPLIAGDEAVLLAVRCGCPIVVGPDRVAAARALLEQGECDLIVSDDGLQHYALERDIEIAVIDGERRFGNGFCLPAGPLREPPGRLTEADLVVVNGSGRPGEYPMTMRLERAVSLESGIDPRELASFDRQWVHAVAGIGNPGRFFARLRQAGIRLEEHVFPDHHVYVAEVLEFGDDRPVVMTEKDAVKCRNLGLRNSWYIPVTIEMTAEFGARVLDLLSRAGGDAAAVASRRKIRNGNA